MKTAASRSQPFQIERNVATGVRKYHQKCGDVTMSSTVLPEGSRWSFLSDCAKTNEAKDILPWLVPTLIFIASCHPSLSAVHLVKNCEEIVTPMWKGSKLALVSGCFLLTEPAQSVDAFTRADSTDPIIPQTDRSPIPTNLLLTKHDKVDAHNVVPVWTTSEHQETMARTIRPKIHARPDFLKKLPVLCSNPESTKLPKTTDWKRALGALDLDRSIPGRWNSLALRYVLSASTGHGFICTSTRRLLHMSKQSNSRGQTYGIAIKLRWNHKEQRR